MHWNLIHKFLSDQCTEAERKQVVQWLREDPEHLRFVDSVRKIWEVKPKTQKEVDVKKAWSRFRSERMESGEFYGVKDIRSTADAHHEQTVTKLKWYQKAPVYAAAAAVLLLITVLFVVRTQLDQPEEITYQQVVTGKGEKTSLKLSDGTRVKLNAESMLKIPSNYGGAKRTLYLVKGEAFFNVEHEASRPFRVYSGGVYTEDIGTRFNLRAFPEDSAIAIVVAEGKVAVGETKAKGQKPVLLSGNEQAIVLKGGKPTINQVSDLSSYIGWTQGKLVFNNTPFKKVMKQIERWYGIECRVKNETLFNQKFTATFENEPLANVLKLISKSMDISARIKGQTVVFGVHQKRGQ